MTGTDILSAVHSETGRTELTLTNINPYIRAVLREMTSRNDFLTTSGELSISSRTTELPTNYRRWINLFDENGKKVEYVTLRELPKDDSESRPDKWSVDRNNIYVYPVPNDTFTWTLEYAYTHPESISTILLDDRFRETVEQGVIARVFRRNQLWEDAKESFSLYYAWMDKLADKLIEKDAHFVEYRDL